MLGDGVVLGDDFATGLTATPLFQTSICPDFMQVYLIFEIVFVELSLVHLVPAIVADCAGRKDIRNVALIRVAIRGKRVRNIVRGYRQ